MVKLPFMEVKVVYLREIKEADAPYMIEWMHDKEIQKFFKRNMIDTSIDDVIMFCKNAKIPEEISNGDNLHFAITDETNEYLGTISLKNLDLDNLSAEYAISTRKKAQGKGIAFQATKLILQKAFFEYKLHRVYLNVLSNNEGAIRLYKKVGFREEGEFRDCYMINGDFENLKWYSILNNEFIQ